MAGNEDAGPFPAEPEAGNGEGEEVAPLSDLAKVRICARTIGGQPYEVDVAVESTVGELKDALAALSEVSRSRQQLLLGGRQLQDHWKLGGEEVGLGEGGGGEGGEDASGSHTVEFSMIVGPPVPAWAEELGLTGEHPALLRDYYESHKLEASDWLASDKAVWEKLQEKRAEQEEKRQKLEGWGNTVQLLREGEPVCSLLAKPGERLQLRAEGFIQNNGGDTCIHQLMLAMDTKVVAELYNGVPSRGKKVNGSFELTAPEEPGSYMLHRASDLQYSMRNARDNFERNTAVQAKWYPSAFVGWLVVRP